MNHSYIVLHLSDVSMFVLSYIVRHKRFINVNVISWFRYM